MNMESDLTLKKSNTIYLSSPVNALVEGLYEENIPLEKIRQHGDFGLGTFNNLDGEMVILDGNIYQVKSDGNVERITNNLLTPFACTCFFNPLSSDSLEKESDYQQFLDFLNLLIPSPNIFYAIRVEGKFSFVKTRSVPRQDNYKPLVEVAKEQPTFTFNDISGTLAGFFTPAFMSSLNVPGLHLHFLSDDRKSGGHLLECRTTGVSIGIQYLPNLELSLPFTFDYLTSNLNRDINEDLHKAER